MEKATLCAFIREAKAPKSYIKTEPRKKERWKRNKDRWQP
jgi:hypothetical protein